jgi:hypothetical protein
MLLFFFELSYELCVALGPSQMFLAYGGGAVGQDSWQDGYHTSKKAAVFGAPEA